jgi:hypothetical protein
MPFDAESDRPLALRLEQFLQLGRQIEDATLEVFRRAWVETHLTGLQVGLAPLLRQHLAVDARQLRREGTELAR